VNFKPSAAAPYLWVLWILYGIQWALLAIAPRDRADWALENVLVVLLGVVWLFSRKRFSLSPSSSASLCVFLALHAIGSHYTYSEVPYEGWLRGITSGPLADSLSTERNHYDRFVHFAAGLLLVVPLREVWIARERANASGAGFVALLLIMSGSVTYELIEWAAASVFGKELGAAYLGTQGDEWDAQKDMALATLGGLLGLVFSYLCTRVRTPK
jgi:putative membrane protein